MKTPKQLFVAYQEAYEQVVIIHDQLCGAIGDHQNGITIDGGSQVEEVSEKLNRAEDRAQEISQQYRALTGRALTPVLRV